MPLAVLVARASAHRGCRFGFSGKAKRSSGDFPAISGQITTLGYDGTVLGIASLLTMMGPPLLAMRIRKIRRVFSDGLEAEAQIVFFRQYQDRGRIEFEFEHEDEVIRAANPVHLSRVVRSFAVGQFVNAIYLEESPKAAFIKEILL